MVNKLTMTFDQPTTGINDLSASFGMADERRWCWMNRHIVLYTGVWYIVNQSITK